MSAADLICEQPQKLSLLQSSLIKGSRIQRVQTWWILVLMWSRVGIPSTLSQSSPSFIVRQRCNLYYTYYKCIRKEGQNSAWALKKVSGKFQSPSSPSFFVRQRWIVYYFRGCKIIHYPPPDPRIKTRIKSKKVWNCSLLFSLQSLTSVSTPHFFTRDAWAK